MYARLCRTIQLKTIFPSLSFMFIKLDVNQSCELEQKKIKASGNKSRHLGGRWGAH